MQSEKFFTLHMFFLPSESKKHRFLAKTVFEGWLAPTLFLVLSLVSTVCGFGRKILHKMTDISSLISKLWHSDSPVSNSLSRTIRRTVRHHCCHHIAGRILQLLKLSSISSGENSITHILAVAKLQQSIFSQRICSISS